MSQFERIATFITVIEQQGFAAAAKQKGISTAAISRQISLLESELGSQLINRTTRHLSLTEVGEVYYQQCKGAFLALQAAENAITASQHEAQGMLTIMANRYFADAYLLPKLKEFMHDNPKCRINLQLAERFPNLEKEDIDILFGVSIEGESEWVRRKVTTTRYVLCASPTYLKQNGKPKKPNDLINHQYITHSMRKPNNIIQFKNNKIMHVDPILFLNDSYVMRECAIRDMGIVNLHDYIVADAIKEKLLVEVLSNYQESQQNIYIYYRQSKFLQPKIRRFIDYFIQAS